MSNNFSSNRFTPLGIDGDWGANTTRALQFGLGGLAVDGNFGRNTVVALQRLVGAGQDGVFGHDTARKLQVYLGMIPRDQDGVFGKDSTIVLQKALNAGTMGSPARIPPSPAPGPGPSPAPHGRVSIPVSAVTFGHYFGGGNMRSWTTAALQHLGLPVTNAWLNGYETLGSRESSGNANAVNNYDSNATGPIASDGNHFNDSRGWTQCIPGTFASYHAAGTSNDIYDPVANAASSINYVRSRYGVANDGSNLAARVQQADASRSPRGY